MRPFITLAAAVFTTGLILPPAVAQSAAPAEAPWVADAQAVAMSVPPKLLSVLQEEMQRSGPEGAIAVCRDKAPAMARAASEHSGWSLRRVSLRHRNPQAVPDAWERATLEDFDRRAAAGETPARLEHAELVTEGTQTVQRYMRALPTADLCLNCHGTSDRLSDAVKSRLAALYPDDRGVGYRRGEIRGAITLRRPRP